MTQWQPIETAPKDGRSVFLFHHHPCPEVAIARWDGLAWAIFDCEDPYFSVDASFPTHWMPPPEPPEGA